MILQSPDIGRTSNQLRWEKECEGNSPRFWCEFCKTLLSQNRIFLTFQNCGILDLPHFCICQYYSYGSEQLYSTVHMHGSDNFQSDRWPVDDIADS